MATKPLPPEDLSAILHHARQSFLALRNERIFLTGGTGLFGHWLLESFLHANRELDLRAQVTVLTRNADSFRAKSPHIAFHPAIDLLEGNVCDFAFPREPHAFVLHAATDSGGQQALRPAFALAESILEGTRHTLRFALATGARRLLFTSTGAVYGRSAPIPLIPETFSGAPDPLLLQSSYDEAKRMAEHLCIAHAHGTSLECVITRPFAFVGPHLPLDAHFAIGNFIAHAIAGTPIVIRGDGTPRRSFLYMADLAVWLWRMLLDAPANRAYNVGSPAGISIADVAHLTATVLRPGPQKGTSALPVVIARTPDPDAPLSSYVPDITRASSELGLGVTVPLEEAIRRTAAWHGFDPSRP